MANCATCGGNKKVKGMGMMNVNCPACKGSGSASKPSLTVVESKPDNEKPDNEKPEKNEKKKGFDKNDK
jgi:hypothetical protein